MPPIDPAWIALIGTIFGGLVLKVGEYLLGKRKEKIDEGAAIRGELRTQIDDLKEDIKALEIERDKYRNDYYALMDKYSEVFAKLQTAMVQIQQQASQASDTASKIDKKSPPPE